MTANNWNKSLTNSEPPVVGYDATILDEALQCLSEGGVVAIPTDTLYGLAADVHNEFALQRVFDIKGRPSELALPVLVGSWNHVESVAKVNDGPIRQLASAFWPGSLTLVLPRLSHLSTLVTGGRETVAVRMPDHWVPLRLSWDLGGPITGTSANRSGQADLKSPAEIREQLGNAVGVVVESGPPPAGVQSTIVDLTGEQPVLLREGATPFSEVMRMWLNVSARGAVQGLGEV